MLDDIAGTYGSRLFVAAGGVAVALLVLVGVLWLVRNRAPSPFVRGGKGRQQRLQVLDAAAIDARRRIVLIRRDGVEHLVMIGGPTDIVIESGIGDPAKLPAQPAIAAPAPLEAITTSEPARPAQQLQAPQEKLRVISRQPEPATQLSAPPVQAAIEAPVPAPPERRPQPQPNPAAPASAPEPAFVAAPVAPPQPPAPAFQSEPPKPSAQPERVEPVLIERREEAAAADILEAARNRVLAPQPERQPDVAVASAVVPTPSPSLSAPILAQDAYGESFEVAAPDIAPPRKLGSDFETVLEAEMSKTLGPERGEQTTPQLAPARPAPEPTAQQQRRDPEMAPIAGGDAALQKEVARIFGEMSVDRER
jgi:Flagellar biosynthesis protein, FliO